MKSLCRIKSRWLLAAALLVALSLTGCSGSNVSADPAANPGPAATVDPGAPTVAVGSSGASPGTPAAVVNPEIPATSVTTTGSTAGSAAGTTTVTTTDPTTGTSSVATTNLSTGATTIATTSLTTGVITTTNTVATVTTNPTTGVTTVASTSPTTGATIVAATNPTTGTATVTTTSAAPATTPGAAPVVTTVATPIVIATPAVAKAIVVQGNLVGDANAALTGAPPVGVAKTVGAAAAPASVPLTTPVSVVLVDETGNVAASQTVTAADGNFLLIPPPGHTYVLLFRKDSPTGPT